MRTKENILFERWRASLPDAEPPHLIHYGLLDAVREIFGWGEQARAVARSEVARAGRKGSEAS